MDSPSSQSSRRENDAWSRYACTTPSRTLNIHAHTYAGTPCSKVRAAGADAAWSRSACRTPGRSHMFMRREA